MVCNACRLLSIVCRGDPVDRLGEASPRPYGPLKNQRLYQMAVVIRLSRHGMKKKAFYRVVAADEDFPRDGRYLEVLGTYDPKHPKATGNFKTDRINFWMSKGAKPSTTVSQILKRSKNIAPSHKEGLLTR